MTTLTPRDSWTEDQQCEGRLRRERHSDPIVRCSRRAVCARQIDKESGGTMVMDCCGQHARSIDIQPTRALDRNHFYGYVEPEWRL